MRRILHEMEPTNVGHFYCHYSNLPFHGPWKWYGRSSSRNYTEGKKVLLNDPSHLVCSCFSGEAHVRPRWRSSSTADMRSMLFWHKSIKLPLWYCMWHYPQSLQPKQTWFVLGYRKRFKVFAMKLVPEHHVFFILFLICLSLYVFYKLCMQLATTTLQQTVAKPGLFFLFLKTNSLTTNWALNLID